MIALGTITQELAACSKAFEKTKWMYWALHYSPYMPLQDLIGDPEFFIEAILFPRPSTELQLSALRLRLRLFRPISTALHPDHIERLSELRYYVERAEGELEKELKINLQPLEWDYKVKSLREPKNRETQDALRAELEARKAPVLANYRLQIKQLHATCNSYVEELHALYCIPECPWDGYTIFPQWRQT